MSKNTTDEWEVSKPLEGDLIPPSATERGAAKLEADLQTERDSRNEERFYWIFALVIIANVPILNSFESEWAFLPTFLLEIILLIGLADRLGVDRVKVLLEKLYSKWIDK